MKTTELIMAAEAAGGTVVRTFATTVIILPNATAPDRFSVAEAAAYCKASERTIREAARAGKFPATEISERAISILRVDLDAWLAKHPLRVRVVDAAQSEGDDEDLVDQLFAGGVQ